MSTHTGTTEALPNMADPGPAPDPEEVEAFVQRLVTDIGAALHGGSLWIGDQLGLFAAMAGQGPMTVADLARSTGLQERYLQEWLDGMVAAEYVTYQPGSGRYELPPAHAVPLADPTFPFHVGGFLEVIVPMLSVAPRVVEAFRHGGGVPQSAYMDQMWEGIERASAPFQQLRLVDWLQGAPQVVAQLEAGGRVADVGCGRGGAAVVLAQAFPRARVTGYDIHGPSLEYASRRAEEAGVGGRVSFERRDGLDLPPATFDVVTTFDVVHDAADPAGLVRAVRNALRPGGTYLAVEMAAAPTVEENVGPVGRLLYSVSLLYCMTTSLAQGGAGLGTCMGDRRFRDIAARAGFGSVRTISIDNPFFVLYELRA